MNDQSSQTDSVRLNKHIALILGVSRRESDGLIEKGRVLLNGETAPIGARYRSGDHVVVNGKSIETTTDLQYIMLNKPKNYVCSRRQQGDSPTIYELLPKELHHLKPVGRLDRDSSGLILLSNDGDFAFRMTHPKFQKTKIYEVTLDHELAPLHHQMIADHGITLDDGVSQLGLERQTEGDSLCWIVTMHEGRNRQIRRTFAALGYEITDLHRTTFGSYGLDDLTAGSYVTTEAK